MNVDVSVPLTANVTPIANPKRWASAECVMPLAWPDA